MMTTYYVIFGWSIGVINCSYFILIILAFYYTTLFLELIVVGKYQPILNYFPTRSIEFLILSVSLLQGEFTLMESE